MKINKYDFSLYTLLAIHTQGSMSDTNNKVIVKIQRGTAEKQEIASFDVPLHSNQTVLDLVSWVQQNEDPTLSYRFACRVGMCGSCAMMVTY